MKAEERKCVGGLCFVDYIVMKKQSDMTMFYTPLFSSFVYRNPANHFDLE